MRRRHCRELFSRSLPFLSLFAVTVVFPWAREAHAVVPSSFTYQGSLKQNGALVNGSYPIEIRITNAAGTEVYWTSGAQNTTIAEGLYRMNLNPTGVDWVNKEPYIETRVDGITLLPREKITSSPYAFVARELTAGTTVQGDLGINKNAVVGGNITAGGKMAIGTSIQPNLGLAANGAAVFTSTATSGTFKILEDQNYTLTLQRTGNKPNMVRIENDEMSATSGIENGFEIRNKSLAGIGSVSFRKFANGYSGLDDSGLPLSNTARITIGGSNIARWVWLMGTNNSQNEGLYFQSGAPISNVAHLRSDGTFFSRGLSVNNPNPEEPVEFYGRTKIMGEIANGNTSGGNSYYQGALRVIGTNDKSSGRMVILQAPWTSSYQTDRYYLVGHNTNGTLNFYIRGDGAFYASSSFALKENIKPFSNSLNKISAINGVRYKWKGDKSEKETLGFIAEDLEKIIPEAVDQGHFVNYSAVVPVLVESIKELKARLEALEAKASAKDTK